MGWGGDQKCKAGQRLDPESQGAGSQASSSSRLAQDSLTFGLTLLGMVVSLEGLPGGRDCSREGAQGRKEEQGLIHFAQLFRQQCRSKTMADKDLAWSQGVTGSPT